MPIAQVRLCRFALCRWALVINLAPRPIPPPNLFPGPIRIKRLIARCFKRRPWLQRPTGAPADHMADPNPATEPKLTRLSVLTLSAFAGGKADVTPSEAFLPLVTQVANAGSSRTEGVPHASINPGPDQPLPRACT